MAKQAKLAPTPAKDWARPAETTVLRLSTGRVVEVKALDLMGELLGGSLPNAILDWVVFSHGGIDYEKKSYQERVKGYYEARLMTVARGLRSPRLMLGSPDNLLLVEVDYEKGEIGPRDLRPAEVDEIYAYLVKGVVPDVPAGFPADEADADAGGTGAA